MNDSQKIYIKDLLLNCRIGHRVEERKEKQPLVINIGLWVDLPKAGPKDDLVNTLDYKALYERIVDLGENSSYGLIETMAEKIMEICLADARVKRARVCVEKPNALKMAKAAGVEITRGRQHL